MKNTLIFPALLAASLVLVACGKNSQQTEAPTPASTTAAIPGGVTHPMAPSTTPPQAQPAPATTTASYQIPPFPVSNVKICDRYASEARRCLNEYASDEQRHAYEREIKSLLSKVKPKKGQPVNEWRSSDCRRGLETLAMRFKQCAIQK